MQLNEAFHSGEQTIAQATVVRTASGSGDQVDVALAHRLTVFCESHRPAGALAFGKAVVVAVGKAFSFKQGNDRFAIQCLHQVIAKSSLVLPSLSFLGFIIQQSDRHSGHEYRLAAKQMGELGHWQRTGFKVFGIRPNTHRGALFAVAITRFARDKLLNDITTGERQRSHLTLTVTGGF